MRDRSTDGFLAGPQHLEHSRAGARAEVVGPPHARLEGLDGQLVRLGQVRGMHIVAHAGPVPGRVVLPVDQDLGPAADRHLQNERDQVALVAAVLAKVAVGVRAEALKYRSKV